MRRALIIAVMAALAAGTPAAAQHVPGAPSVDWDRATQEYTVHVLQAYNQMIGDWRRTFERREVERAADHYADGAFLFIDDVKLVQGRDEIRSYLEELLPALVEIRTGLSDFAASDRLAYALGPFMLQIREPGRDLETFGGTHMTVLVREGRRWRIRSQVLKFDTDRTPATAGGSGSPERRDASGES